MVLPCAPRSADLGATKIAFRPWSTMATTAGAQPPTTAAAAKAARLAARRARTGLALDPACFFLDAPPGKVSHGSRVLLERKSVILPAPRASVFIPSLLSTPSLIGPLTMH